MEPSRSVHMVGSLPADIATPEAAMRFILDTTEPHLGGILPSGETNRGRMYIAPIVEALGNHPALEPVTSGDWSSVKARPTYRLRRGRSLREAPLDDYLGYFRETRDAWPAFQSLRAEYNRADLRFQVGLPSPFGMSFMAFNQRVLQYYRRGDGTWPYYRPMAEATAREAARIQELLRDNAVFQVEVPAETLLAAKAPPGLRRLFIPLAARSLTSFVAMLPHGTRIGVHLCFGSLHNKPSAVPRSTSPMVELANAIARRWPAGRELTFVHIPMADGERPPLHGSYYAHLRRLALPRQTRVIAGLAHEHQPLDEQRRALELAESAIGRRLDVASACGLGRRPGREAARAAILRAVDLATS